MNHTVYQIMLGIAVFIAVLIIFGVFVTGKGDAMSGGGGNVRTTFKGKQGFEDKVFTWIFGLGCGWIVLTLALDFMAERLK